LRKLNSVCVRLFRFAGKMIMSIDLSGFTSTADLTKQLITLSTGILALSITFIKDILKSDKSLVTWKLTTSWVVYLLSITSGIWTMMALTGTIFEATCNPALQNNCKPDFLNQYAFPYGSNISVPLGLQILLFLTATGFLIAFGAQTLRAKYISESQMEEANKKT